VCVCVVVCVCLWVCVCVCVCVCLCVCVCACERRPSRVFVQTGRDPTPDEGWGEVRAGGQMVSLMVAEIKEGIRRLQGVHSDGNYSK